MNQRKNYTVLTALVILFLLMLALAFASVPIYRLFCQKTGYGGTVQLAYNASTKVIDYDINVRFNADTHRDLAWEFKPLQSEITVKAGATGLAFYKVRNKTRQPATGIAIYNVTPSKAGVYFHKIHCFCFEEQEIGGRETQEMPVQFYIDPAIADDPNCRDVKTITLSYTFFHAKDPNIPEILGLPNPARITEKELREALRKSRNH